jgi:hypothetical protein
VPIYRILEGWSYLPLSNFISYFIEHVFEVALVELDEGGDGGVDADGRGVAERAEVRVRVTRDLHARHKEWQRLRLAGHRR